MPNSSPNVLSTLTCICGITLVNVLFVYALDGKCVSDCGAGFYSDEISEECEPCHRTCATCKGFKYNDCITCKGSLQLLHGKCVNHKRKQIDGKFWNGMLLQFFQILLFLFLSYSYCFVLGRGNIFSENRLFFRNISYFIDTNVITDRY